MCFVMNFSTIIAIITACAMIASVLFKPYVSFGKVKIGLYVVICFIGAVAELLFGGLSLSAAITGITADTAVNPLKILVLFFSMTMLSVFLDEVGFFRFLAGRAAKVAGKYAYLLPEPEKKKPAASKPATSSGNASETEVAAVIAAALKQAGKLPL